MLTFTREPQNNMKKDKDFCVALCDLVVSACFWQLRLFNKIYGIDDADDGRIDGAVFVALGHARA